MVNTHQLNDEGEQVAPAPSYDAVVLYYKRGAEVAATIASVSGQTVRPGKILVYDNGSDDGIVGSLTNLDPVVQTLVADENQGYAGGMNAAVRALTTNADYLLLLTHEVLLDPDAVRRMLEVAGEGQASMVGPELKLPTGEIWSLGGIIDRRGRPQHRAAGVITGANEAAWLDGCALLARSSTFVAVDGFDENFYLYWDDVDICTRVAQHGPVLICGEARATQQTGTTPIYFGTRNRILYWRKQQRPLLVGLAVVETLVKLGRDFLRPSARRRGTARIFGLRDGVLNRRAPSPDMIAEIVR